jgi:hypothetical protein
MHEHVPFPFHNHGGGIRHAHHSSSAQLSPALLHDPVHSDRVAAQLQMLHNSIERRVDASWKKVQKSSNRASYDADELKVGFHITLTVSSPLSGLPPSSKDAVVVEEGSTDSAVRVVYLKRHFYVWSMTMARSQ